MDSNEKPVPDENIDLRRRLAEAEAALNAVPKPTPTSNGQASQVSTEETLRLTVERYRSLFDNMTEGFALHKVICDDQGIPCDYRFLEINPSFERLTGIKR